MAISTGRKASTTTAEILDLIRSLRVLKAALDDKIRAQYGPQVTTRLSVKNLPVKYKEGKGAPAIATMVEHEDGSIEQFLVNTGGAIHLDENPANDDLYLFFTGQE